MGGNYKTLKATAVALGMTDAHMLGQSWRAQTEKPSWSTGKKPIEYYLVEGKSSNTTFLKSKLISEGILAEVCAAPFCPVPNPSIDPFSGEEKPLKLVLDHINGINSDNRLTNLRLLCHHCHAETETFCGKNVKRPKLHNPKLVCSCGKPKKARSVTCRNCNHEMRRANPTTVINWPDLTDLVKEVRASSYSAVGRRLGVSDNAVKKHITKHGYDPKNLTLAA